MQTLHGANPQRPGALSPVLASWDAERQPWKPLQRPKRTVQDGLSQALDVVGGDSVREGEHPGDMLRDCHLIHLHHASECFRSEF